MTKNLFDFVIIGAGPAGLSAAIYGARAKYRVLVLEKDRIGGQITITSEVVNYPGVESISGADLTEKMRRQAESFGAEFKTAEVTGLDLSGKIKKVRTSAGEIEALGIIIATGANPRKIGFKGEREFQGRGVAYCATCDGEFFTGKDVLVIGGGFAAVEEAIFLTRYAAKITICVRRDKFSCARSVVDKLAEYPEQIRVLYNTEVAEVSGDSILNSAKLRNNLTGEEFMYESSNGENFGVFVFAGYVPNTAWLPPEIARNEQGYIVTDIDRKTSVDGVYAAGDLCEKNLRQVVTAVSDGAVAATSLEKAVAELHQELGIGDLTEYREVKKPAPQTSPAPAEASSEDSSDEFLTDAIKAQLAGVFARLTKNLTLRLYDDGSAVAAEMKGFLDDIAALSEWLSVETAAEPDGVIAPSIRFIDAAGKPVGIEFHGVPGGHELNSFVIAIYNAAGPGQAVDEETLAKIGAIGKKTDVKVLVSLSCTKCPETVMSAQRIATLSDNVTAQMFDLAHFPEIKQKYNVMSVPCIVVNDEKIHFGKKNVREMADIILES